MDYEVRVTRTARRTVQLSVGSDGSVTVRLPERGHYDVGSILKQNEKWIEKHRRKVESANPDEPVLSCEEVNDIAAKAHSVIPARVEYYAGVIGVKYNRITLRMQKTRWGSCSSKGNLNFNCMLVFAPDEVLDSVIVHELCHRKEMNHSKDFYNEVRQVFPQYDECREWLKKNGSSLLKRIP